MTETSLRKEHMLRLVRNHAYDDDYTATMTGNTSNKQTKLPGIQSILATEPQSIIKMAAKWPTMAVANPVLAVPPSYTKSEPDPKLEVRCQTQCQTHQGEVGQN